MPRLEAIGRLENPEDLDLEPVTIPVIGYTADHDEVEYELMFRPVAPTGEAVDMLRAADANGNVPLGLVLGYLDACIIEDCREGWQAFLHDPDIFIEQPTIVELYEAITEYYSARPTPQRSVSHNGRTTSRMTSRAAAPSTVSTSTDSSFTEDSMS